MSKKTVCWKCGNEVPKIDYKNFKGVTHCSKCNAPYPEKPKTEAKLSILQDKFLNTRKEKQKLEELKKDDSNIDLSNINNQYQKELDKLFFMLHDLTFNIICSKLKGSAMRLDKEEIEDMVQWSLIKLLSYYNTKPNFKINGSFTGYISMVVLYPLYNQKKKLKNKKEVSLNAPLSKDKDNNQTLLDRLSLTEDKTISLEDNLGNYQSNLISDEIVLFIKTTLGKVFKIKESEKSKSSFSFILNLLVTYKHFIDKKTDRFFTEYWKTSSLELQDTFKGTLTILEDSLKGGYL